jgi:hypothetical protein
MRHALRVLLATGLLGGVALAEDAKPESGKRGAPEAPKPESANPEGEAKTSELIRQSVELLDAGKKPLERLRYAPKSGTEWLVTTTVTTAYDVTMGGKVVQKSETATVFDATQRIETVSPKGEAKVKVTIGKTVQTTTPATPITQNIDRQANERYGLIEGRSATLTYDARGLATSVDAAAFDDLPDDLATLRKFLLGLVQGMSLPLPEEPVGVGARWRLRRHVEALGVTVTAEDTFGPLARGADKRWQAKVLAQTTAEPQDLPSSGAFGLPETLTCRLVEWKPAGEPVEGGVTLRLEALGFEGKSVTVTNAVVTGETESTKLEIPLAMRTTTELKVVPAPKKTAGR